MTDEFLDPLPGDLGPTPDQTPQPEPNLGRVLTSAEASAYGDRLGSVGYSSASAGGDEPYGFDVTGAGVVYNYRYDATATTAVELMERICAERGC